MRMKLGVLVVAGVLFAAAGARADCCDITTSFFGPKACNIFGCNCSGPCSNFGYTCEHGPITDGAVKGYCPGYTWCDANLFCGNGTHCEKDPWASDGWGCFPDSLAQSKAKPIPARKAVTVSRPTMSAGAAERFREIDTNHDGRLSFDEVKAWAAKHGTHLSDSELKKKFDEIDANQDGAIHPTEFDTPAKPAKKK